jgi:hypothetical protein
MRATVLDDGVGDARGDRRTCSPSARGIGWGLRCITAGWQAMLHARAIADATAKRCCSRCAAIGGTTARVVELPDCEQLSVLQVKVARWRKIRQVSQARQFQKCPRRHQKTLEGANIKLGDVASDILGVSARRMLEALIGGTTDPAVLADLAKDKLRKKDPPITARTAG